MFETAKFVRQRSEANILTFVHDESDDFDSLHSAYMMFKQVNPDIATVMGGFRPLDDKLHPPLQAADMMANYTLSLGIEGLSCGDMKANVTEMRQNLNLPDFWHYPASSKGSPLIKQLPAANLR
jgi:hypothetical protein